MASRMFKPKSERVEGRMQSTYRLTCSECGTMHPPVINQARGGAYSPELIIRTFTNKGWSVGKRDGQDKCPACVNREQEQRRKSRVVTFPKFNPKDHFAAFRKEEPVAAVAEPPREMSRDDRRVIFAKLDEVYIDEKVGYSKGWTDKRVAEDLGIPRAWVAQVRDENFGPATSEEIEKALAECRQIIGEMKAIAAKVADLNKQFADLSDRTNRLGKQAGEIEKAVR